MSLRMNVRSPGATWAGSGVTGVLRRSSPRKTHRSRERSPAPAGPQAFRRRKGTRRPGQPHLHHRRASQRSAANGANAALRALEAIARLVTADRLRMPVAASFPVGQIRRATELQAGRHVHGKVVIDL
ncbi:zinc-binding dehydrogenase [Microbispora rosea]|uniref:zinc-binding dehydrogenase n=1 Tax=Microbispora rosea TaxID=58117 RepID=UPI0037B75BFC